MRSSFFVKYLLVSVIAFISYGLYAILSFSLTDPNLVLLKWPPFWSFQQMMWQIPKQNITIYYIFLLFFIYLSYFTIYYLSKKYSLRFKHYLILWCFIISPLIFSSNGLSHDVFNYIFNARMVMEYQVDPHVRVAMDFMYDPWTRFMHNVHTPAPYYYGWTILSLVPYILGFEKFLLTWILFRLWSMLGFVMAVVFVWLMSRLEKKNKNTDLVVLLFNPLLVIELISNSHNDGWMMWPAMASFYLLLVLKHQRHRIIVAFLSFVLLLFSISTKYATVVLVPVWGVLLLQQTKFLYSSFNKYIITIQKLTQKLYLSLFDLSAILLFLPLLSARSQQFHPWYLSWSLLFYPLIKNRFLRCCFIVLSVSSMFRYVPWLWYGAFEYTPYILELQKYITWTPLVVFMIFLLGYSSLKKKHN